MGKAIAMDSPWITCGLPDKSREYFALLYYRPLNKYPAIPGFLRFASQIQKQSRSTPGIIGYSLRAKLLSRDLDSLCLGRRKNSDGFRRENSAWQAKKAMMPHLGPTKFTKWNVLCSAPPLGWEETMQRSKKGERS